MIFISEDSDYKYYLIEEDKELDAFEIGTFSFFRLYGIENYEESFKMWLRKFPRPNFIIGVKDRIIISFIYIDPWEELPMVANVLRAQETVEQLREKKIWYKMFLLGLALTPEYLLTKPLTARAKVFYERIGFVDVHNMSLFSNYHQLTGYLALPLNKKSEHMEKIKTYFTKLYL